MRVNVWIGIVVVLSVNSGQVYSQGGSEEICVVYEGTEVCEAENPTQCATTCDQTYQICNGPSLWEEDGPDAQTYDAYRPGDTVTVEQGLVSEGDTHIICSVGGNCDCEPVYYSPGVSFQCFSQPEEFYVDHRVFSVNTERECETEVIDWGDDYGYEY